MSETGTCTTSMFMSTTVTLSAGDAPGSPIRKFVSTARRYSPPRSGPDWAVHHNTQNVVIGVIACKRRRVAHDHELVSAKARALSQAPGLAPVARAWPALAGLGLALLALGPGLRR